ncbi:MAG: GGDEF domain-containing protein [bacterium]|nr:GGDEF domain-containing protein [bacterium]
MKTLDDMLVKWGMVPGEAPTTEELEWLKESRERVGMVIRARWAILAVLAGYAVYAYFFYLHATADALRVTPLHQAVAVGAFFFAVAYNAWYQYTYRWFSRIRQLNQAQLLFDLVFVTVIVHFSGGAVSWFWAMYLILTLEAALIMDKASDTYAIAMAGMVAYGGVLTMEFYKLFPPVPMPFENNELQSNFSYEMIKWGWISIVNFCVAFIGVHMMDTVRRREAEMRELVTKDALTSFYNRRYFFHRLNSEIQRAKRYGRTLSLLILDVDDFKRFNDTYGHLEGDALLRRMADLIRGTIRRSDAKPSYEVDIACRYGGEEFAVILPEAAQVQGAEAAERLRASIEARGAGVVAEKIRQRIEATPMEGKAVTVSIGVSSFPEHGTDVEAMIRAADDAMYKAKRAGKNRVVISASQ